MRAEAFEYFTRPHGNNENLNRQNTEIKTVKYKRKEKKNSQHDRVITEYFWLSSRHIELKSNPEPNTATHSSYSLKYDSRTHRFTTVAVEGHLRHQMTSQSILPSS